MAADFFRLKRLTEKVLERILGVKVDSKQRFWVLLDGESSDSSLAYEEEQELARAFYRMKQACKLQEYRSR